MRAAPALQVVVTDEPCARAGVALLCALAAGALAAWLGRLMPLPVHAAWLAAAVAAALGAGFGWRRTRCQPRALQWDTRQWWLRDAVDASARSGSLQVMIDLGGWMLLRFEAEHGAPRWQWLAVSHHQHGPAWHALRTAVHARAAGTAHRARSNLRAPPQP
jgi:hypothetical protein